MSDDFRKWLRSQIKIAGLSQRALARQMNMSQAYVNEVFTGSKSPSTEFCRRVAEELNVDSEFVFRLAGILPPASDQAESLLAEELLILFRQLTPGNQNDVLSYARWRLLQQPKK